MTLKNKINGIREIWQFSNRWQLLFNRLLFSNEKINIYRFKDLEILMDHAAGDANGSREVLTSKMYRQFLNRMDLENDLNVLDFGANNGGFPLLLISMDKNINKLVCVEFNPQTFSRMRFNIERNLDCQLRLLNVAVCGQTRQIQGSYQGGSTSHNIYPGSKSSSAANFEVQGLTFNEIYLDNFNDQVVDICKMDIEGAEFEVFAGDQCDQIKNCRYLLVEIHHEPEKSRESIRRQIRDFGFEEFEPGSKSDEFHHVHLFINKEQKIKSTKHGQSSD